MENAQAAPAPAPEVATPQAAPAIAEGQVQQQEAKEEALTPAQIKELRELAEVGKNARELRRGAHQTMEEAAKLRKQVESRNEQIRKDAIKAILEDQSLGLSKAELRAQMEKWYKQEFVDPELMTAEQREIAELKRYKDNNEAELASAREKDEKRQQEEQDAHARGEFEKEMIDLIDKAQLPKTRFTLARLAFWKKQNLANGYDAPTDVIVQQVKDERMELIKHDLSTRDAAQIVQDFGEEIITKLRKYDLERLKSKFERPNLEQSTSQDTRQNVRRMSEVDQYFRKLRYEKLPDQER